MCCSAEWKIIALIVIVMFCSLASSSSDSNNTSNDNCWTNDAECLVQVTLHRNDVWNKDETKFARESLPMEIDCMAANLMEEQTRLNGSTSVTQPPNYLLKLFERAFRITLNGCRKALKWSTFGFEYLPNCAKITEMKVTRFHADASYELHCPIATFMPLEILRFEHNEIGTITTEALSNLSLLKELYFRSNALRHIERGAFDSLHFIERIQIEAESLLAIKDATLFERTNVVSVRLFQLKFVTSALFEKLPQTLRELHVEKTTIGVGAVSAIEKTQSADNVSVNNSDLLSNISIIECALKRFRLNDDHGSVQYLNLSGNLLEEFHLTQNGTTQGTLELKTLDLSRNCLEHLPLGWLDMLKNLEKLYLNHNSLKTLPLMPILLGLPVIQNIDLRSNQLEVLTETTPNNLENEALYRVLVYIDKNPWNCKWLLAFAHTHPELFRIFHYEKFLSQINVNGLECVPEEPKTTTSRRPFNISTLLALESNGSLLPVNGNDATLERMNISTLTLFYGPTPHDLKRNQRNEALIIVFMLPVGIAALFLLLYLWIYCQKVFHLSFYRNCRLCKRRKSFKARRVNHFDVVRQFPQTTSNTATTTVPMNNEDYELPLNGVAPICNCAHSNSNSTIHTAGLSTLEKCQKTHHITYVPLPDEKPQKIYEEIIGGEEEQVDDVVIEQKCNESHVNTIYDHLSFESSVKQS